MPGNYVVVTDQWEDWSPGDVIPSPITATTATSMSTFGIYPNMAYPGANSPQTWTINVNASTGVATVTNQYYGKYSTSQVPHSMLCQQLVLVTLFSPVLLQW